MQALKVLRMVRGTQNVQLEYDDITAASKVAAQVTPDSTFISSPCPALLEALDRYRRVTPAVPKDGELCRSIQPS